MARLPPAEEVVDAEYEVVQQSVRTPTRSAVVPLTDNQVDPWVDPSALEAQYGERARAIALFVKVPVLAYVALSDKMPALVRLGALALAALEVREIARQAPQLEALLPYPEF